MKTGIIILAAGESSRLGYPKQIARYKDKTLLQYAIDAANGSKAEKKVLVLGAFKDEIKKTFSGASIPNIPNPNWGKGMASTLIKGLEYLQKINPVDQVIIMLCDQPFVDSKLLNKLIATQKKTGKGIVACEYSKTFGVPILFGNAYFEELMKLTGDEGAKKIAQAHSDDLELVSFPKGKTDVDTEADLRDLNL
ncbi:nucleotidyltransferase family protein [Algoriphagus sp.]|uniref:nucleotidyltransferase family protein n=1 Tax=Algoriphagus sp. TaxID=1872435 RepID=UPI0025DA81AC|nr:nucleotidyltransferase family protein [Algoriphagus sp.]